MADKEQSYTNHAQVVPMYHYVALGLLQLTFIGACVNLYQSWGDHSAALQRVAARDADICHDSRGTLRAPFALRAQDRAIRAEEQLRHYVMTGKLLDPRLTVQQIVGLRFASNEEFVTLAQRAADQSLSSKDIKQAVRNWRADTYRV